MLARLAGIVLLLASAGAHAETDLGALFDEAVANVEWDFADRWAYTETSLWEEQLWVARHDPRVAAGDGWTLLSVDGREPTAREARRFLDAKKGSDGASEDNNRVVRVVEADSLRLVEETATHWLLSFLPEDEEEYMSELQATLRIVKDGRYVESLDLRNTGVIKPGFATKLTSVLIKLTFGPAIDGGPIVPKDVKVRVAGRALLFISIEENEVIKYSDFEYAGNQKR